MVVTTKRHADDYDVWMILIDTPRTKSHQAVLVVLARDVVRRLRYRPRAGGARLVGLLHVEGPPDYVSMPFFVTPRCAAHVVFNSRNEGGIL